MAHPRSRSRPIAPEVPDPYRQDFSEACTVLPDSPKASRRAQQAVPPVDPPRTKLGAKKKDLNDQIDEVIAAGSSRRTSPKASTP